MKSLVKNKKLFISGNTFANSMVDWDYKVRYFYSREKVPRFLKVLGDMRLAWPATVHFSTYESIISNLHNAAQTYIKQGVNND